MIYLLLTYEFMKIGLFSFGGGYATIPFLYNIAENYGWYTVNELTEIFAIASVTPGPIGINAATYAGFMTAGIVGSLCATISEIIPSLILVIIISKLLKKFGENFYVKSALAALKPTSCALLIFVILGLIKNINFGTRYLILLAIFIIVSLKIKKDPLFYITTAAIFGIICAKF